MLYTAYYLGLKFQHYTYVFFNRKERHLSKSTPAIVLAVHEIFDGQDNGIYNEMVELSNEYWHLLYSMQKTVD